MPAGIRSLQNRQQRTQIRQPPMPVAQPRAAAAPAPRRRQRSRGIRTGRPGVYHPPQPFLAAEEAASAYAIGLRSGEPTISGSFRSTRIRHRELVASVSGSSTFTVSSTLALNPGLAATFPWLSTQALGWEQYRFHALKFCEYTRCATSTAGSLMLVPDYDAADAAPSTETIASAYRDVVEDVPWVPLISCPLDPRAMCGPGQRKFIRTGALAANLDVKTYDSGTMFVCTTDGSATNWGKLWVEYDVEFFVPQLSAAGSPPNSVSITSGGVVSNTAIFGTTPTVNADGAAPVTQSGMTLTFPAIGDYFLAITVTGTGTPVISATGGTIGTDTNLVSQTSTTGCTALHTVSTNAINQTLVLACTNVVTSSSLFSSLISASQYDALTSAY
jgi:hypothetical protein